MFLTQLSATAPATRDIITFEAPAPRTREAGGQDAK
jgi:hypothetical protein